MSLSEIPGAFTTDHPHVKRVGIDQVSTVRRASAATMPHLVVQGLIAPASASGWSISPAKRVLDIVAASLLLILASPMILFTALMVRLTSAGPVLFAQRRVGRYGKLFTIYKFRSMTVEGAQLWPGHTKHRDPRLTAVGARLRKYKLDELPQLFNVLRGDMSLVGPRPKLPGHESMYMSFRPGITGAATLAFRREEEMLHHIPLHELERFYSANIRPVKHQIDSEYMARATFGSDLLVLVQTVTSCLHPIRMQLASARHESPDSLVPDSSK